MSSTDSLGVSVGRVAMGFFFAKGFLVTGLLAGCAPTEPLIADPNSDVAHADFGYELDPEFDYGSCPGGRAKLYARRADGSEGRQVEGPAEWTVIHFGAADNNLERSILKDIDEMHAGMRGSSAEVNVVGQIDLASEEGTFRYEVTGDALSESDLDAWGFDRLTPPSARLIDKRDEIDSSDRDAIVEFANWAVRCFPAESYGFILGGHGTGWSLGAEEPTSDDGVDGEGGGDEPAADRSGSRFSAVRPDLRLSERREIRFQRRRVARTHDLPARGEVPDERAGVRNTDARMVAPDYGSGSQLHVDELAEALREVRGFMRRCGQNADTGQVECENPSTNRFVFYGSDACLMGGIEVAHELRNGPKYIIGSEELEPGLGWPYSTVMRALVSRPEEFRDRNEQLMELIVEKYEDFYLFSRDPEDRDDRITLSVVYAGDLLEARNAIDRLGRSLTELLKDPSMGTDSRIVLQAARAECPAFGDGKENVDLGCFLQKVRDGLSEASLLTGELRSQIHDFIGPRRNPEIDGALQPLERTWEDLVVATAIGEKYRGARGLSIRLPASRCGTSLDLGRYREASIFLDGDGQAAYTGWVDFIEEFTREASLDFDQAYGYGELTYSLTSGTTSLEDIDAFAECELWGDYLYVYIEGFEGCVPRDSSDAEDCAYPPDLSFDVRLADGVVTGWDVYSPEADWDIASSLRDEITVEKTAWDPHAKYAAKFAIEARGLSVDVEFACETFEPHFYCDW